MRDDLLFKYVFSPKFEIYFSVECILTYDLTYIINIMRILCYVNYVSYENLRVKFIGLNLVMCIVALEYYFVYVITD